jgi:DNA-binding beta-propeller fold protein YncE
MTAPVNQIVDTIPLPLGAYRVIHTGSAIYAAGRDLLRIDPATKRVTQPTPGTFAGDLAFVDLHQPVDVPPGYPGEGEPDKRIYVAVEGPRIGQIAPYFDDRFTVYDLSEDFHDFAVALGSNSGERLYLFDTNRAEITVVDPTGLGFPRIVGSIPVGKYVTDMVISPDDRFIYAAHIFEDAISVVDTGTTPATVTTVPVTRGPVSLALSADGSRLFVSQFGFPPFHPKPFGDNTGFLTEYDTTTWRGSGLYTGFLSGGVTINAAETRAYVSNTGDGTLSVIDISSGLTYLDTISGFVQPTNMCISPDQRHLYVCQDDTGHPSLAVVAV